eukprot:COSAG03_NODE_342_length_8820_cov_66.581699_3_plen_37_part_00
MPVSPVSLEARECNRKSTFNHNFFRLNQTYANQIDR